MGEFTDYISAILIGIIIGVFFLFLFTSVADAVPLHVLVGTSNAANNSSGQNTGFSSIGIEVIIPMILVPIIGAIAIILSNFKD